MVYCVQVNVVTVYMQLLSYQVAPLKGLTVATTQHTSLPTTFWTQTIESVE